jgi:hypothetical protein
MERTRSAEGVGRVIEGRVVVLEDKKNVREILHPDALISNH